jgi:hypothetical protein
MSLIFHPKRKHFTYCTSKNKQKHAHPPWVSVSTMVPVDILIVKSDYKKYVKGRFSV